MSDLYKDATALTGPLSDREQVTYKKTLGASDSRALLLFLILTLLTSASLVWFLMSAIAASGLSLLLLALFSLVILVELIRVLQSLTLLVFAHFAQDPVPMTPASGLRIAVLTTIVPGKEPFELVARTLKRMKKINPGAGNTVDVWLLDEGNDENIKWQCYAMGVNHFSRKGVPEWNMTSGAFKAKTKHGNHNAWRSRYENKYDIVAQMDPDHIPHKDFLLRTIGYFKDQDVAFVVAPQVYGNLKENWIAKASAFQAYVFHGIIQRGGNGMGAPLLIGTNHLYRVSAFKQIGGYQDSIIEDHLTSMIIYGARNQTGKKWKGVYTPDILAVGEGPTSFTDYFNQQKRWAYGIWEILQKSSRQAAKKMTKMQALTFAMLQFFYPSVAAAWILSSITTIVFGIAALEQQPSAGPALLGLWAYSIISSLWLFFWLRKFNLVEHERKDWGIEGMSLLLMCIPVYVSAAVQAIMRKPLTYAVTAKGSLTSLDSLATFKPHFNWILINAAGLVAIYTVNQKVMADSAFWIFEHMVVCAIPIAIYGLSRLKNFSIVSSFKLLFATRRDSVTVGGDLIRK